MTWRTRTFGNGVGLLSMHTRFFVIRRNGQNIIERETSLRRSDCFRTRRAPTALEEPTTVRYIYNQNTGVYSFSRQSRSRMHTTLLYGTSSDFLLARIKQPRLFFFVLFCGTGSRAHTKGKEERNKRKNKQFLFIFGSDSHDSERYLSRLASRESHLFFSFA